MLYGSNVIKLLLKQILVLMVVLPTTNCVMYNPMIPFSCDSVT